MHAANFIWCKETTFKRADFTLLLLMFVTAEKEGQMFTNFFPSIFCQLLSPPFEARTGWVRPDHESSDQPAQKSAVSNVVSLIWWSNEENTTQPSKCLFFLFLFLLPLLLLHLFSFSFSWDQIKIPSSSLWESFEEEGDKICRGRKDLCQARKAEQLFLLSPELPWGS